MMEEITETKVNELKVKQRLALLTDIITANNEEDESQYGSIKYKDE